MLYLDVPYVEKDEAKSLGAKWDKEKKKWYVEKRFDYPKFVKWILKGEVEAEIICDHVFLIVGKRKCYRCGKETPVITFGVEKYCRIWDKNIFETKNFFEWIDEDIHITPSMPDILDMGYNYFESYIEEKYNYHIGYSKAAEVSYQANHCIFCDSLQGDYYLNQEVDSPFFIDSPEKVINLQIFRIDLPYDKVMDLGINWSSADWMIKEYADIRKFECK